jgi:hypothetical protein
MYPSFFESFESSFDQALRRIRAGQIRMADLFERPVSVGPLATSVAIRLDGNKLSITTRNRSKVYRVDIPDVNALSSESPVHVYQSDSDEPATTREETLGKFITEDIPDSYRRLHDKVISVIQNALAAVNLKLPAAAKPVDASAVAPASQSEGQPEAASSSQEASQPANSEPLQAAAQPGDIAEASAQGEGGASSEAPADTPEFTRYMVRREGQPDLEFQGKLIAQVHSLPINRRQHALEVYETSSGKFVGVKAGLSWWPGERARIDVKVGTSKQELVELFGYSYIAKALYEQLDLSTAEVVD